MSELPGALARAALDPGEPLLLPYQQRLLATTAAHQVVVCEKSRRVGFTWAIAADAVLTAGADRAAGGMDVFYLAYEKEMTREFIDTCAEWAKLFEKAASAVEEVLLDDAGDGAVLAFRIRLASGHEIVALSSQPRGLRGRQGYVIVDEAAFHDRLDEVLKAALALLIWGGKVLVLSTHNGVDNPFAQLVDDVRAGRRAYALVRVTFDDAIADGLYRRICKVRGLPWSAEGEAAWRERIVTDYGEAAEEELFCVPRQAASSWLPYDLIVAAEHGEAGLPEGYTGGPCVVGNDIARRGDRWVAWVLERVGDVLWAREEQVLQHATFEQQDDVLDGLMARYRVARLAMDQTGMGEKPVEDAQRRYGSSRVEGVLFAGDRPLNVAMAAKRAFEEMRIRLPAGDADLRRDLFKIKKVSGPTGHPRLVSGRDATGHADRAWALFLAIAAAEGVGEIAYGYQPAPRVRRLDEPAELPGRMMDRPPRDGAPAAQRGAW